MGKHPLQRTPRVAGMLYLVAIVCAGFAEGYVRTGLIVPGDAAATVDTVASSEGLYRVGFVSDLVAFLCDAAISVLLYVLLRPVSKTLALLAAAGYLVECFGSFLFPSCEAVYVWLVAVPAAVAELSLALWLLIKGIRTDCLSERPRSAL